MRRKKTWAIYGGSFNPPHFGHLFVIEYLLNMEGIDGVLIIPTYKHPDGKNLVDFNTRVEMLQDMISEKEQVFVSRVEEELGGVSYSIRTVQHLVSEYKDLNFRFIVGSDCVMNKQTWGEDWDKINAIAPMFVIGRAGCEVDGVPTIMPNISSTKVRALIKELDLQEAAKLLPKIVLDNIIEKGLYC